VTSIKPQLRHQPSSTADEPSISIWHRLASRKTSAVGGQKNLQFEPCQQAGRVQIFSARKRSFSCEPGAALNFFASFLVSRQQRKWGMGQRPMQGNSMDITVLEAPLRGDKTVVNLSL
jgi:hypothetical protein